MANKAQMKELCKSTGGFICLHRSILKWEWSDEPMMVYFWTYLLLNAAAKTHPHRGTIIERGQLVTSLQKLSERTTLSQRSIRTMLKRLLNAKQIDIQADTHFSRITICKYDTYQYDADIIDTRSDTPSDTRSDKAATSDRQAIDKRPPTYNKGDTGDTRDTGDIGETNTPPNPLAGGSGESQTESFQLDATKPERTAKRERKPAQDMPSIPEALNTPQFQAAWDDFISHRKSIRKPLTPKAAELNLKKCLGLGHDNAISAIEQTIANGWTGIFEPKNATPGINGSKPKRDPRVPAHISDEQAGMWILHQETNCYSHIFGDRNDHKDVD